MMPAARLFAAAMLAFAGVAAAPALSADKAIIVLDGSGSMWAQIDGRARITIARETLRSVMEALPPELELGLMTYGHRQKGSCSDIELLVEPAAGTGQAIIEAADEINPLGKTPISDAVRQAAEALNFTEDKATVILITDGLETCEADPCALASDLEQRGIDFTAHVVGFGLTEEEGRQVACLAENTGGTYFEAGNASGLRIALTKTVSDVAQAEVEPAPVPAPEPEAVAPEFNFLPDATLAEGGPSLDADAGNSWEIAKANADGSAGEYISTDYGNAFRANLEPGDYVVIAKMGEASVTQPVTIVAGEVAEPTFVINAGRLVLRPKGSADGPVDDGASLYFEYPGGGSTTTYGETSIYLPAGETRVTVGIGAATLAETFAVAAGETIEKDVVVGAGRASVNAFYVEGMKVEDGELFTEIFKAAKAIDGSREQVSYAYGPDSGHDLAPGDYVAVLTMGETKVEAPFSINVGELTEVSGVLNAGVLAVSAPGASSIEVFAAKKDIQGNRKSFGLSYDVVHQATLPAGDYAIVATMAADGSTKEGVASVVAGERAEVAVE